MAADYCRAQTGFAINGGIVILNGTADPSDGAGVAAPIGSIYAETDSGNIWHKYDSGDTAWKLLLDSGGASTEDGYQNSFTGKSGTGSEMPDYSSVLIVADSDSLETAIGKLDAAGIYTKRESNKDASSGYAADTIAIAGVDIVEWVLTVRENATPANMCSRKIRAVTDGTNIDFNDTSILLLGTAISGLAVNVSKVSTDLVLTVTATPAIDYVLTRVAREFA